jgi:hypothetical protein
MCNFHDLVLWRKHNLLRKCLIGASILSHSHKSYFKIEFFSPSIITFVVILASYFLPQKFCFLVENKWFLAQKVVIFLQTYNWGHSIKKVGSINTILGVKKIYNLRDKKIWFWNRGTIFVIVIK